MVKKNYKLEGMLTVLLQAMNKPPPRWLAEALYGVTQLRMSTRSCVSIR